MASPQVLDRLFGYENGGPIAYSDQITYTLQGAPVIAATFFNEFAGATPVPKSAKIDVRSFITRAGVPLDVIKKFLKTEVVKLRLQFGGSGKIANLEGFVTDISIQSSVTEATTISFSYICNAAAFA